MEPLKNPIFAHWTQLEAQHKTGPGDYEYFRRKFIPIGLARQCVVSVYEIPPGKAAYPYHCHLQNEEVFFILSGTGTLRTPEGERPVSAGELLFFPAEPGGPTSSPTPEQSPWSIWTSTPRTPWTPPSTRIPAKSACGAGT